MSEDIQTFVKWTYVSPNLRDLDETRLSKNFVLSEFSCKCKYQDCNLTLVSTRLIEALQLIREVMKEPLEITCGYRCERHNLEVGGVGDSWHTKGLACDFRTKSRGNMQSLLDLAYSVPSLGGLGRYFVGGKLSRLHMDFRPRLGRLKQWEDYK